MHDLIQELQQYHKEKATQLAALDDWLSANDGATLRAPDRIDLQEILLPFNTRQEIVHHHNEEMILLELRQTNAPIHRRVEEISQDHEAFERIIGQIMRMVGQDDDSSGGLHTELRRFGEIYDDHATGEETIFFPLADQYLQVVNWDKVAKAWRRD